MGFLKKQRQKVVENVEVYSKHVWLRLAIVVVLVLVGISLLAYAITNLLSVEKGWREIELNEECYKIAPEIKLNYNLGASGASATLEYQRLSDLYSDIALKASKVFDSYEEYDGVGNLATISSKLNSEVSVDPLLYDALKLITDVGDRHLYLAPLYIENTVICSSNDDDSAALNDPEKDEIAADYFLKVMEFAGSDDHIRLELRDTNKVTLKVSKEYKAFIDEWQIDTLIDLHWLKNAFIVDAIADELIAQGYTYGNVTAYNGFFRNLDKGSQGYDFDIYSLNSKKIYRAATISLSSASSVVSFRSFPLTSLYPSDDYTYYVYEDGTVVSPYLSYEDGLNRCAVQNLVSAAPKGSCAEIALSVYKYYSADSLDTAGINSLKDKGIKSAWIDGVTVYYNDDSMKPKEIFSSEEIEFELKKVK